MKNRILVYTLLVSSIPFQNWAQKSTLNENKTGESQTNSPTLNDQIVTPPTRKIKYYHVEEIYDMKSGGHKTTYDVSDVRLIQTYDLGSNNRRIITPVYSDQSAETVTKSNFSKKTEKTAQLAITDTAKKIEPSHLEPEDKNILTPALAQKEKLDESGFKLGSSDIIKNSDQLSISDAPKKVDTPAYIDIIKTYEGVIEKGYETLEVLKKVANSYFFDNELEKAEKYYNKLFRKTSDLEPEYYYRYSVALKATNQIEKADEFLKKFHQLSSNSSK
jgi:tetratricopeptide (TPR) repeat protein